MVRVRLTVVLGALVTVSAVEAATVDHVMYADRIIEKPEWVDEGFALGVPNSNGDDGQFARTANNTTTVLLKADSFSSFVLPANQVVTHVWVNAKCRYNTGTSGNRVTMRVSGSAPGTGKDSPTWSQGPNDTSLRWVMNGNGWNVTGLRTAWSQADVRGLDVAVRRNTGSTPLRVDGLRIIVRTESDSDGDGVADSVDPDRDGDGVSNTSDCAPDDPSRWRNRAYYDEDGDGVGAGSLVTVTCFGSTPPAGYVLTTGDPCPKVYSIDPDDDDNDGVPDASDCADCDPDAWRNQAYLDSDRDGIGAGGLVAVDCFGETPPFGYALTTGDNCHVFNPLQDPDDCADDDGDTIVNAADNCRTEPNQSQTDTDDDGIGDACDPCISVPDYDDWDADCVTNDLDNCPEIPNTDQFDTDGDGIGDACDSCPDSFDSFNDSDGDEIDDVCDNCTDVYDEFGSNYYNFNPDQSDVDGDGLGDTCDGCPDHPGGRWDEDRDLDGIPDACDHCPDIPGGTIADCNDSIRFAIQYIDGEFDGTGSWYATYSDLPGAPVERHSGPMDGIGGVSGAGAIAGGSGQTGGGIIDHNGNDVVGLFIYADASAELSNGRMTASASSSVSIAPEIEPAGGFAASTITMQFEVFYPVWCNIEGTGATFAGPGGAVGPGRVLLEPGFYGLTIAASTGTEDTSASWSLQVEMLPLCSADLVLDGELSIADVQEFVARLTSDDPAADLDGNGVVDFFDMQEYLVAFSSAECSSP